MTIYNIFGVIVVKLTLWKRFVFQVYKLFSNTIYWFGFCFMKMRWAPVYCNDTKIPMHYFSSCRDSSCVVISTLFAKISLSRFEYLFSHFAKAIARQNCPFGPYLWSASNIGKTTLELHWSCSIKKRAWKNT